MTGKGSNFTLLAIKAVKRFPPSDYGCRVPVPVAARSKA